MYAIMTLLTVNACLPIRYKQSQPLSTFTYRTLLFTTFSIFQSRRSAFRYFPILIRVVNHYSQVYTNSSNNAIVCLANGDGMQSWGSTLSGFGVAEGARSPDNGRWTIAASFPAHYVFTIKLILVRLVLVSTR